MKFSMELDIEALENHQKIDLKPIKIITEKIYLNQIKTLIWIKFKSSIKSFIRKA